MYETRIISGIQVIQVAVKSENVEAMRRKTIKTVLTNILIRLGIALIVRNMNEFLNFLLKDILSVLYHFKQAEE
jgi:hypothetical protein